MYPRVFAVCSFLARFNIRSSCWILSCLGSELDEEAKPSETSLHKPPRTSSLGITWCSTLSPTSAFSAFCPAWIPSPSDAEPGSTPFPSEEGLFSASSSKVSSSSSLSSSLSPISISWSSPSDSLVSPFGKYSRVSTSTSFAGCCNGRENGLDYNETIKGRLSGEGALKNI